MTPSRESNNAVLLSWRNRISEPYVIINAAFALIILMVFGYSLIFSPDRNEYPVVCIHEKLTGVPCPSCGLSHSFSLILRGRIVKHTTGMFMVEDFHLFCLTIAYENSLFISQPETSISRETAYNI